MNKRSIAVVSLLLFASLSCSNNNNVVYRSSRIVIHMFDKKTNKLGNDFKIDEQVTKETYLHDSLISIETYNKDTTKLNGRCDYYHGKHLVKTIHYRDDTLCGNYIEYYLNSSRIKKYFCYDSYGSVIIYRSYNDNQNPIVDTGNFEAPCVMDYDYTESHNVLIVYTYIPKAPYTSININNYILYNAVDTIKSLKEDIRYDWEHDFYFNITEPGVYQYFQKVQIVDSQRKKTHVDTRIIPSKSFFIK